MMVKSQAMVTPDRIVTRTLLWLQAGACVLTAIVAGIAQDRFLIVGGLAGAIIYGGLLVFYQRGYEWPRFVAVIITTLIVGGTAVPYAASTGSQQFLPSIFIPPALALIMANPLGVAVSGVLAWLIPALMLLGQPTNPYLMPLNLLLTLLVIASMVGARYVLDTYRARAAREAANANLARARAEADAAIARELADERARDAAEKQRLLDLVDVLEVPVIPIGHHGTMLLVPIVGAIEPQRLQRFTDRLLAYIHSHRSKWVIIDLTSVSAIDTAAVQRLVALEQSIRLLGCSVTLTGISSGVAAVMGRLDVSLGRITTMQSVQDALSLHQASASGGVA